MNKDNIKGINTEVTLDESMVQFKFKRPIQPTPLFYYNVLEKYIKTQREDFDSAVKEMDELYEKPHTHPGYADDEFCALGQNCGIKKKEIIERVSITQRRRRLAEDLQVILKFIHNDIEDIEDTTKGRESK